MLGPLAGEVQTVPRAELTAAVETLRAVEGLGGDVELVSDCKSVTDGFQSRKADGRQKSGANLDLWDELMELIEKRKLDGFEVKVRKIRAHVTEWHVEAGLIDWPDFVGNEFADAHAKAAAVLRQIPRKRAKEVGEVDKLARSIQSQIIATNIDAIAAEGKRKEAEHVVFGKELKAKKAQKKKKSSISELLSSTGHALVKNFDHNKNAFVWKCGQCLASKADSKLAKWLRSHLHCPAGAECGGGEYQVDEEAVVGEQETEPDYEEDVFGYGSLGFDDRNGHIDAEPKTESQPAETAKQRLARLRAAAAARIASSTENANFLRASQFNVGNLKLHGSHKLHHRRGIVWCWHCAAYGTEALKNLSKPCAGRPGRGAQCFLDRLKAGNPPRKDMDWPVAEGIGPLSGPIVPD